MKVCIIGCGKMGQAILHGWLGLKDGGDALSVSFVPSDFFVVEHTDEKCQQLTCEYGVEAATDIPDLNGFDMVVLAVKPQVIDGVLDVISRQGCFVGSGSPLFVSIAAGVPTEKISGSLNGARVVRVMPNTPLQVGEGATVVAAGAQASEEDVVLVRDLFGALGFASIVDEDQIDAACALSGGGPAYVARMVEALRDAGIESGLEPELAEHLAEYTFFGTCKLMQVSGQTPEETRVAVCSPGGTTLAALGAMHDAGFEDSISSGIRAAVLRAKELAS